jgi:hypothetical protein
MFAGMGTVGCICGSAGAAEARVVYVYASDRIPPGQALGDRARCPGSAPISLGGAFRPRRPTDDVVWSLNLLDGDRYWFSGALNRSPTQQFARFAVACSTSGVLWNAGGTASIKADDVAGAPVTCPRQAPRPLTAYFGAAGPAAPQVALTEAAPAGGRRFRVTARNLGSDRTKAELGVLCAPRGTVIAERRSKGVVDPGATAIVRGKCPRRARHPIAPRLVAGPSVAPGSIVLSYWWWVPERRGWEAGVRNLTNQPLSFTAGAACLR